ncbi:MAG: PH domain-containing protein [Stackebrandtia sp.]
MSERSDFDAELVARPKRTTRWCWAGAAVVLTVCVFTATTLRGATEGGGTFTASDQFAMAGIGVLGAAAILVFTRPRVWAGPKGVKVRNLVTSFELPWQVVVSVQYPKGASWVMLELADDDLVAVMAIQAVDKEYAVEAARRLRALLAESKSA